MPLSNGERVLRIPREKHEHQNDGAATTEDYEEWGRRRKDYSGGGGGGAAASSEPLAKKKNKGGWRVGGGREAGTELPHGVNLPEMEIHTLAALNQQFLHFRCKPLFTHSVLPREYGSMQTFPGMTPLCILRGQSHTQGQSHQCLCCCRSDPAQEITEKVQMPPYKSVPIIFSA